jgi:hypothetical protein
VKALPLLLLICPPCCAVACHHGGRRFSSGDPLYCYRTLPPHAMQRTWNVPWFPFVLVSFTISTSYPGREEECNAVLAAKFVFQNHRSLLIKIGGGQILLANNNTSKTFVVWLNQGLLLLLMLGVTLQRTSQLNHRHHH